MAFSQTRLAGSFRTDTKSPPVYATGLTATVLLGTKQISGQLVAIKIVQKKKLGQQSDGTVSELKRAQLEVEVHRGLVHAHLVPLLEAEETADLILLVTPYAEGGDLWSRIKYGATISEPEVRNCAAQILSALKFLHCELGLVHADVKPHNVLLFCVGDRFRVQLCDFGLTEKIPKGGKIPFTGLRGTSGYFAPEMLEEKSYDGSIDVFALGVMLFRMVGGYEPFFPAWNFAVGVDFDPSYWSHISELGKDLIGGLLRLDPAERLTASCGLSHPWFSEQLSDPVPLPDRPYGAPPDPSLRFLPLIGS